MATQLGERDLERLCWGLVREHRLALPLDPWKLCRSLGTEQDRPIRVVAADLGGPHSVGHLVSLPNRDIIFYDAAAPRPVQIQIICHEVVHLVRGHLDSRSELTCGALLPSQRQQPDHGGLSLYAEWKEWEAELGGSMLSQLANLRPEPAGPVRAPAEIGLAAAFGLTASGERRAER